MEMESLHTMTTPEYYEDDDWNTSYGRVTYATPCSHQDTFQFAATFSPVVFILVFVLAVVGNILVLCVVRRYRQSSDGPCTFSLTDTFLLHLAISDLLLAFTLPFYAVQWTMGWIFGTVWCKIVSAIFSLNLYGGILLLGCISFDRYLAIVHAVSVRWHRRSCHAQVACGVVWTACLGLAFVDIQYQEVFQLPGSGYHVCHLAFHHENSTTWFVTLQLINLILGFGLPLLVMLYCYIRIFRSLCHVNRRQKRKSLNLIISLVTVFLLCWAPYNGFRLMDTLLRVGVLEQGCQLNKLLDFGTLVSESLGLAHCALNPLLYGFVGVKFRKELVKMWKSLLGSVGLLGLDGWGKNQRRRRITTSQSSESENTSYFSVMV